MALFSQDDIGEDNERGNSPDFSGGEDPQDPDAETETPSPVEVDQTSQTPEVAQPDDANAYAQSPDDEESQSEPGVNGQSVPGGDGGYGESAGPQNSESGSAQLPSMPQYVDNLPNYQALEKEISNFKPSDYKPSVGRRILGSLAGAAVTFGSRNPQAGATTVQRVEGKPLAVAQAQEQQTEQATRQQIADVNAQNQTRQAQYQNQRVAANDAALNAQRQSRATDFAAQAELKNANWQPDDPTKPLGSYHATGINGRPLTSDGPPTSVQKRPEVVAAQRQADVTSRRAEGTAQGLTGDDLNSYALTGKIPNKPNPREPRQPAVGEVELNAATTAFKLEHGGRGPQTLDEQNQVIQASKGMLGGKSDPSQVIVDSATKYADGLQRVPDGNKFLPSGSYVPASISAQDLAAGTLPANVKPIPGKVYEDTLQKARDQVRQHGDDVDQNWNLIKGGGRTQPVAAPAQQSAAPKTFNKAEIPQNVPLPAGNVWVKSPNGVVGHIPQANLQKAIARGYSVPDGQQSGGGSGPPNPQ